MEQNDQPDGDAADLCQVIPQLPWWMYQSIAFVSMGR